MRARAVVLLLGTSAVTMLAWWLFAPASFAGGTSYVTTNGVSMEPVFLAGDLVVLRTRDDYAVGEIAGYRSALLGKVVLHRIVAVEGGAFVMKGDNNDYVDVERPTADDIVGAWWFSIPGGGVWFERLTSPAFLAGVVFLIFVLGGASATTRRRRRRRREMAEHSDARTPRPGGLSPALGVAIWCVVGLGAAVAAFAFFAYSKPLDQTTTTDSKVDRTMTLGYSAMVPLSAAYHSNLLTAPSTVFRSVTDDVTLTWAYAGPPGEFDLALRMATRSGWDATVPLEHPTKVKDGAKGQVAVNLAELWDKAQAAAEVIGVPSEAVTLTVEPVVTTLQGTFAPTASMSLDEKAFRLQGDPKSLVTNDQVSVPQTTTTSRTLTLLGVSVPVATARELSPWLLGGVALVALLLFVIALLTRPKTEAQAILRKYGALMVPVDPMPTPPGRPVVDVVDFAQLAKLAERYGLLVMYWSRNGIDTFVVQDESTTYRYRAVRPAPDAEETEADAAAAEDAFESFFRKVDEPVPPDPEPLPSAPEPNAAVADRSVDTTVLEPVLVAAPVAAQPVADEPSGDFGEFWNPATPTSHAEKPARGRHRR